MTINAIKIKDQVCTVPTWNKVFATWANKGRDIEKVVAVAATREKIAIKSITLPVIPSIKFPKIGRHASENFCFLFLDT